MDRARSGGRVRGGTDGPPRETNLSDEEVREIQAAARGMVSDEPPHHREQLNRCLKRVSEGVGDPGASQASAL